VGIILSYIKRCGHYKSKIHDRLVFLLRRVAGATQFYSTITAFIPLRGNHRAQMLARDTYGGAENLLAREHLLSGVNRHKAGHLLPPTKNDYLVSLFHAVNEGADLSPRFFSH